MKLAGWYGYHSPPSSNAAQIVKQGISLRDYFETQPKRAVFASFFLYASLNKLLKTEAVINSPPFYIFDAYQIADGSYPYRLRENFFLKIN